MSLRRVIGFLAVFSCSFQGNAAVLPIVASEVVFDVLESKPLTESIGTYLNRFVSLNATEENRLSAETFLNACYFVSDAVCQFVPAYTGEKLLCNVKTKRVIIKLKIFGLPASLLESELKRKLPIEVGQTIDLETKFEEIKATIQARTEVYLRKNGYYGAVVSVSSHAPDKSREMEFVVKIEDGAFAIVNDVKVIGDSVVSSRVITKLFKRMCLRFDKIFEAISLGTLACYSKELEREAETGLQDRLAKKGYVQARIRIGHQWIDPTDPTAPKYCQSKSLGKASSRCVNLKIEIDRGSKVTWSINVRDRVAVNRNGFLRFLSGLFEVDLLSRATASEDSDETPLDQLIIEQDLLKRVSFVSARNVDEQEIAESAADIKKFLVGIGYINAEVIPHVTQNASSTLINFDVYASIPYSVRSVQLSPERYLRYVSKDDLDKLISIRSVMDNGHLSYEEIESARLEIEQKLHAKGFTDINVKADLVTLDEGGVHVDFYVASKMRETVHEIIILNGHHDLNESVAPLLNNCDNFVRPRRRAKTRLLCRNSSFVKDKLEEDANRLAEYYQNSGFLYAKVVYELVKKESGQTITFKLYDSRYGEQSERPLNRQEIKDIIITGNQSTRTDVIKRLFPQARK